MKLRHCRRTSRELQRVFGGETLSVRHARALREHIIHCEDCHGRYDRTVRTWRLIESAGSSDEVPCARELAIFSPLSIPSSAPAPWRERLTRSSGLFLALAGASLAMIWFVLLPNHRADDALVVRAGSEHPISVRFICESQDITGRPLLRSLSEDPSPAEVSSCPASGILRFAYLSSESGYLTVWTRSGGEPWTLVADGSEELEPAVRLTPLTWRVELTNAVSELHIRLAWSDERLSEDDILKIQTATAPLALQQGWHVIDRHVVVDPL